MIFKKLILLINILYNFYVSTINAWHSSIEFDFKIDTNLINNDTTSEIKLFESVYSNRDYFSLLSSNRNNYFDIDDHTNPTILVGARNYLYQLRLPDLALLSNQLWTSSQIDILKCINRSIINNKDECDNYVKLYLKVNQDTIKICSTNALNPKCRFYSLKLKNNFENVQIINETAGIGQAPMRAYENKYVYNFINQRLYTANSIDLNRFFTSINGLYEQDRISTNMDDNNWLYRADFVSSFTNDERLFFVFNEDATFDNSMSSLYGEYRSPQRFSQISHICLNDRGAPLNSLRNIWTTFLKSKLSCIHDTSNKNLDYFIEPFNPTFQKSSLFYFDEIKSISELFTNSNGKKYFYGVFTTSSDTITASAVCLFSMDQIMETFHGDYKTKNSNLNDNYDTSSSEKIKKYQTHVPNPRPSECPNTLTYQHLIFSRKNFIMEKEILSHAIIVETSAPDRFLSINVDFEVKSKDEQTVSDVLFIGTENGRVLTFVVQENQDKKHEMVYSEELNLFDKNNSKILLKYESVKNDANFLPNKNVFDQIQALQQPKLNNLSISNLKLFKNMNENKTENKKYLVVITQNKIMSLPGEFCSQKLDSNKCNNKIYPYCIWSVKHSKCFSVSVNLDLIPEVKLLNQTTNLSVHDSVLNRNLLGEENVFDSNELKNETDFSELFVNRKSNDDYKAKKHEITISINIYLLLFLLALFLVISMILSVLFFIRVYGKVIGKSSDKKEEKNTKKKEFYEIGKQPKFKDNIFECLNLRKNKKNKSPQDSYPSSQQSSPFHISSSVSYSSTSSSSKSTKSSHLSTYRTTKSNDNDPRYVCLNSKYKPCTLNIADLENQIEITKSKFLDYDDTEYYSLKRKKALEENIQQQKANNTHSSFSDSSQESSFEPMNSYFTLIRAKLEPSLVYDTSLNTINESIKTSNPNKYYL